MATALTYFIVCTAQSTSSNISSVIIFFVFALLLVIPFLTFLRTNKKFKEAFPQYEGKYLWSLLFFPIFYIMIMGVLIMSPVMLKLMYDSPRLNTIILLGIVMLAATIFIQIKIKKLLFGWNAPSAKMIKRLMTVLVCLPPVFLTLYPAILGDYSIFYPPVFTNTSMDLLFSLILGGIVWSFANKKLNALSDILPSDVESIDLTENVDAKNSTPNISLSDQLIEIKGLLDGGVISEEEFQILKQNIINQANNKRNDTDSDQ